LDLEIQKTLDLFSSDAVFTEENIMLVVYKCKRNKTVFLLSSQHSSLNCAKDGKRKPEVITIQPKKGLMQTYTTKMASRRWHVVVFHNILDIALFNAYVLFISANPNFYSNRTDRRRRFLKLLGKAMIYRNAQSRLMNQATHPSCAASHLVVVIISLTISRQ
jgi:hypothetical protein